MKKKMKEYYFLILFFCSGHTQLKSKEPLQINKRRQTGNFNHLPHSADFRKLVASIFSFRNNVFRPSQIKMHSFTFILLSVDAFMLRKSKLLPHRNTVTMLYQTLYKRKKFPTLESVCRWQILLFW